MDFLNIKDFENECLAELRVKIPDSEYQKVMSQEQCELDGTFLGFIAQYKALSLIIPKEYIIIDFGCYLAPQAYFFDKHSQYIGIDTCGLERFKPNNTSHFICSIKQYLSGFRDSLSYKCFAIANYVPSKELELIKKHFENLFIFYPTIKENLGGLR